MYLQSTFLLNINRYLLFNPLIISVLNIENISIFCASECLFENGTHKTLFAFYPDELSFQESEFVDLTEEEAQGLRQQKDRSYLRS